jgi:hypothetical protein
VKRCSAVIVLLTVLIMQGDIAGTDARRSAPEVYWGAYASGARYGGIDAPWDMRSVTRFEANTDKRMSLLEWGQAWWECSTTCGLRPFRADLMQRVRRRGTSPF